MEHAEVELLGPRILTAPGVGGVAVAVLNLGDFAGFDVRGPVPRLDDEAVFRKHVAKGDDLVVGAVIAGHHLADRRHPAADQTLVAIVGAFLRQFLEVLDGVIGSSVAAGIDRHRIRAFACSNKSIPGRSVVGVGSCGVRRVHRGRRTPDLIFVGIAVGEELIGKQIGT